MREQPHQRARHILRRLARIIALVARQEGGIEQQDRVDIRGIVQLARALFTQRQRDEALRFRSGRALGDGMGDGGIQRAIGQLGQRPGYR